MFDDIFGVLAAQQRRQVLLALLTGNPSRDGIETIESGAEPVVEVSEEQITLYHNHLPRLEDEGFIRWDREEHVIEKGPRFGEVKPLLELLDEHADELLPE